MPGFIAKFGKEFNGTVQLDADDLAMWGAVYTAGYIAILFLGSPINDLIGRKFSMLGVQLFMVISTVMSLVANNVGVWGAAKVFQVSATSPLRMDRVADHSRGSRSVSLKLPFNHTFPRLLPLELEVFCLPSISSL